MEELQDYSGAFRPDLKMQDFSKDALIRLWQTAGLHAVKVSQFWTLLVMEKFGIETALELSRQIWTERGASETEVNLFREAMNRLKISILPDGGRNLLLAGSSRWALNATCGLETGKK